MVKAEDRRDAERVGLNDSQAICHYRGFGEHYQVEDLSVGGAKLRGGPVPPVGARVRVVIFVANAGMVCSPGLVVRREWDDMAFSVRFDGLEPSRAVHLADVVGRAYAATNAPADYLEHCPP